MIPHIRHCPPLSYNMVGWWAAEIVPGCQEPPLEHGITYCGGAPCPQQPCRTKATVGSGASLYEHAFVGGQWTKTDPGIECKYVDGLRTECAALGRTWRAERDELRRVVRITTDKHTSQIVYDTLGRASSIDGHAVAYDEHGRMTKFGDVTMMRDERGRVVREESPTRLAVHEYDAKNRVVKIAIDADTRGDYIITYDDKDRVTSWSYGTVNKQYEYCDQ